MRSFQRRAGALAGRGELAVSRRVVSRILRTSVAASCAMLAEGAEPSAFCSPSVLSPCAGKRGMTAAEGIRAVGAMVKGGALKGDCAHHCIHVR